MKVVLMNNRYGRNAVGGAERIATQQAVSLKEEGWEVAVLATESFHGMTSLWVHCDANDFPGTVRLFPLNIVAFENLASLTISKRLVWHCLNIVNIHSAVAIAVWLRRVRPQHVITHNIMGIGLLTAWAIRWGAPAAGWTHVLHDVQLLHPSGLLWWGQERSWRYQGFLARWYRTCTRWLIGSPHEIVSPSRWLLNEHQQFGFFKKSQVVIRRHSREPMARRASIRSDPDQARMTDGIRLLFLGQIEQHKGIEFLLHSFPNYQSQIIPPQRDPAVAVANYQLHVVGSGSLFEQLRADHPHHQWHGHLEGAPLEAMWQHTDAVVVPSLCYENAPTVIMEALERGIPIVASRIGGIPELIDHGVNGWLFSPGDKGDLLQALERMIKSKYPDHSITG